MGNLKAVVPIAVSLVIAFVGSYFIYTWIQKQQRPSRWCRCRRKRFRWWWRSRTCLGDPVETGDAQDHAIPQAKPAGRVFFGTQRYQRPRCRRPPQSQRPRHRAQAGPGEHQDRRGFGGVGEGQAGGRRKGDKVIGIAGFINPGNRVDVLVTIEDPQKKEERTKTILENIMVMATGTQIEKNEKGEPSPVDVYTLAVTPRRPRCCLWPPTGETAAGLRSVTDTETVLTSGVNVPKMLTSYSPSNPPPPPKQEEAKEAPKVVQKWAPRPAVSVEVIKGNEISQKKF